MASPIRSTSALFLAAFAVTKAQGWGFDCPVSNATLAPPKNISYLQPGHVSIVMAMGDSITAAFAAKSTVLEAREISWSIGTGTDDQPTLPYFLSKYHNNADYALEGMSTEDVLPRDIAHLPHNDYHPNTDRLNFAESEGAVHRGSLDEQWQFLTEQLPQYKDLDKRWKVFTVWMMANDVCGECNSLMDTTLWSTKMDQLLTNVTSTMNNVLINLVSTLDLSNVHRIQQSKLECKIIHKIIDECGCIDRGNATQLKLLDANTHALNAENHKIAVKWQQKLAASGRDDVAVVVQGFQEGQGSTLDDTFLSNLDCFHPSTVGHKTLAVGLWNSMLCTNDRANGCGYNISNLKPTCPMPGDVFYTGPDVVPNFPPL